MHYCWRSSSQPSRNRLWPLASTRNGTVDAARTNASCFLFGSFNSGFEQNVMLVLKDAPFSKTDPSLNPEAGACVDCPKRTGANVLLFADIAQDACTDPACYE